MVNALSGRKYRKLQMNRDKIIPIKNDLEILGFKVLRMLKRVKQKIKKI